MNIGEERAASVTARKTKGIYLLDIEHTVYECFRHSKNVI